MTPIDQARAWQNKVRLYEKRATDARSERDSAIREALQDGHSASALGAVLGLSEGAVRSIAKSTAQGGESV